MQAKNLPRASPLPTAPPHPRDVAKKLVPRSFLGATCGWVDGDFSSLNACPSNDICAHDTAAGLLGCCDTSTYPYCQSYYSTCLDSTDVAASCSSDCESNTQILKCTQINRNFCVKQLLDVSTISTFLTGWDCEDSEQTITLLDRVTTTGSGGGGGAIATAGNSTLPSPTTTPPGGGGGGGVLVNPSTLPGPSPTIPPPAVTTSPVPSPSHLSTGAKAGIAIGAVLGAAIILALIILLFLQRRRHNRQTAQAQPIVPPMQQQQQPMMTQQHPLPPATNPQSPSTNPHTSMLSHPSQTSSSTPLTGPNLAALSSQPQPQRELGPQDSVSNIGGPAQPSSVTQPSHQPPYSNTGSNTGPSPEQSGVGSLPAGPQYPTGAAAFPHYNPGGAGGVGAPSTVGPGSAFGSMPPGRGAPSAM